MGCYVHSDNNVEWLSIKEELKQIHSLYSKPNLIVMGDFNNFISKMDRTASKVGMKSYHEGITRKQTYGDKQ